MAKGNGQVSDDLQAEQNLRRIDDLETFRNEFEGLKFYEKVSTAIGESKAVEGKIKEVVWQLIKDKAVYFFIAAILFVVMVFGQEFFKQLARIAAGAASQSQEVQSSVPMKEG